MLSREAMMLSRRIDLGSFTVMYRALRMTCSEDGRLGILLSHGGIDHTRHGGNDGSGIVAQLGVQRRVGELDHVALLSGLEQLRFAWCGPRSMRNAWKGGLLWRLLVSNRRRIADGVHATRRGSHELRTQPPYSLMLLLQWRGWGTHVAVVSLVCGV